MEVRGLIKNFFWMFALEYTVLFCYFSVYTFKTFTTVIFCFKILFFKKLSMISSRLWIYKSLVLKIPRRIKLNVSGWLNLFLPLKVKLYSETTVLIIRWNSTEKIFAVLMEYMILVLLCSVGWLRKKMQLESKRYT